MADIRHKRNGQLISEPRNWEELEITKDFIGKQEDASINNLSLIFAGEEGHRIIDRIFNGMNGGVGIFEGDLYTIEVGDAGDPAFTFDGYLDYADGVEIMGCNEIKVSLKKRQGNDWLNEVADGFSFRYLYDKQVIKDSDFVHVPYIINYIPDAMQLIMLAISTYLMVKEAIEAVKATAEAIGDVVDAVIPVVGTGVGFGAVVVTAWDIGNIILTILKAAALLAYTALITYGIIKLMEQIFEQLMPLKRYHLGMTIKKLFEKGCEHLGMTLRSDLLDARGQWTLIPPKGHRGGEKPTDFQGNWKEVGVPGANDGWDTFGDLIRVWKEVFNADFRIKNGEFRFERRDYWENSGVYVIGDFFTDQKRLLDQYKPNVDEIISNYNINYAYDTQDQNTLDQQQGRVFQAITTPKVINNANLVNIKHLQEIGIRCSLGLRKNELTIIEEVLKELAKFIDGITGAFGNGTNFAADIEARKGSLLLSSHFITVPKLVAMAGGKLANNQREIVSATTLWNELHYINSFAEVNGEHNQYMRYEKVKVPFCTENFIALLDNNNCQTEDGKPAIIEKLKWKSWENTAVIDYRVKQKYTDNLKIEYIE